MSDNSGDIRSRVFAQCGELSSIANRDIFIVNLGEVVEKLLLFDKYIIRSVRLQEIPHFINTFGFDATIELLKSDAIELHSDIIPVVSMPVNPKQTGRFSFKVVTIEFNHAFVMDLDRNRQKLDLPQNKLLALEEVLAKKVVHYPENSYKDIQSQFTYDLKTNTPNIKTALVISLKQKTKEEIIPEHIEINVEAPSMEDVRIETNLRHLYGFTDDEADEHISSALFAIGGLNERILQMKTYKALTGFKESELPVFEEKLKFLEHSLSPELQVKRLQRILEIKDFPDLDEAARNGEIDLIKLLEIRQNKEIKEFRNWLFSIDSLSEKELSEKVMGFKSSISSLIHSKKGKSFRWLASNGIGSIPVVGQIAGPVLSILDYFLETKVFPENGALTFIHNIFPTIFKNS